VLVYKASDLPVARHFTMEVATCAKAGAPPKTLKVDAHMPEHRHGMNYAPKVTALGPGRWRAEGLMLHMPGKWEFVFVVDGERMAHRLDVSGMLFFDDAEKRKILAHGPWPPPARRDPSNRVSGKPEAIALGERLFFEPRLSGSGSVLCASCHVPFRAFQDGRARAFGLQEVDRNTPSLFNVGLYRWYGWDGGHDSLWSQSIRPLLDAREMDAGARHVAAVIRGLFLQGYREAFEREPPGNDEDLLVDAGKALAAFQETLVSPRTAFDAFRDAVAADDREAMKSIRSRRSAGCASSSARATAASATSGRSSPTASSPTSACRSSSRRGRWIRVAPMDWKSCERADSICSGATTTTLRAAPPPARATSSRSTATSASGAFRGCATSRAPRRTCTTAAWPRCATW
jgi:hypothetical protein